MIGVPPLREQIALKPARATVGCSTARTKSRSILGRQVSSAVQALVQFWRRGILFDPHTILCARSIAGRRATHTRRCSRRAFRSIRNACGAVAPRTRLVMLNTPHNPTATIASASDLDVPADLLRPTSAMVLGRGLRAHDLRRRGLREHRWSPERTSAASRCSLSARRCMPPAGASIHGCVGGSHARDSPRAPVQYSVSLRRCSSRSPISQGVARAQLAVAHQRKRDRFSIARATQLQLTPAGAPFQPFDFSSVRSRATSNSPTPGCAKRASRAHRSRFTRIRRSSVLRFCFAKNDSDSLKKPPNAPAA